MYLEGMKRLHPYVCLAVAGTLFTQSTTWAQTPTELSQDLDGGAMMEELIRLTMLPLAEEALTLRGLASIQRTAGSQATSAEFRWDDNGALAWTDDLALANQWNLWVPGQTVATFNVETREGSFWPELMMAQGGLTSEPPLERVRMKPTKSEATKVLCGHECIPYEGKVGKDRAVVWMVPAGTEFLAEPAANAYRQAFSRWLESRVNTPVLQAMDLPDGIPLSVAWGAKDLGLSQSMDVLGVFPKARLTLDAPSILMLVPGRDINQVAKEFKEREAQRAAESPETSPATPAAPPSGADE